jgi:hypothetical protein
MLAVDGSVWMSAALTALFALPVTILGLTRSRDATFSFFSLLTFCMLGLTVFLWIKQVTLASRILGHTPGRASANL